MAVDGIDGPQTRQAAELAAADLGLADPAYDDLFAALITLSSDSDPAEAPTTTDSDPAEEPTTTAATDYRATWCSDEVIQGEIDAYIELLELLSGPVVSMEPMAVSGVQAGEHGDYCAVDYCVVPLVEDAFCGRGSESLWIWEKNWDGP